MRSRRKIQVPLALLTAALPVAGFADLAFADSVDPVSPDTEINPGDVVRIVRDVGVWCWANEYGGLYNTSSPWVNVTPFPQVGVDWSRDPLDWEFTLPSNLPPGTYLVRQCDSPGHMADLTFTVIAAAPPPATTIPATTTTEVATTTTEAGTTTTTAAITVEAQNPTTTEQSTTTDGAVSAVRPPADTPTTTVFVVPTIDLSTGGGQLPQTGSSGALLPVGAVMLAAGASLVVAHRRRPVPQVRPADGSLPR
jgi:LPXTG-motif cell wall-anchored protein